MAKIVEPKAFDIELIQGSDAAAAKAINAKAMTGTRVLARDDVHVIENYNPRVTGTPAHTARVRKYADSLKADGWWPTKPGTVVVTKGEDGADFYAAHDMHTRLLAYDLAIGEGWEGCPIPVIVMPKGTSQTDLDASLAKGNDPGAGLTPYEMGILAKRMIGRQETEADVSKALGITPRYLNDLLLLMSAPKKIRDMVMKDELSATLAIEELRNDASAAAERLSAAKVKAEDAAAKGKGTGKVTGKHLDKPAAKPPKKQKGEKATPKEKPVSGEVQDAMDMARINGLLDAMVLVEALEGFDQQDHILKSFITASGNAGLITSKAIQRELHETAGFVRLGLVEMADPAQDTSADDKAAGL